jgi:hypothetical protein
VFKGACCKAGDDSRRGAEREWSAIYICNPVYYSVDQDVGLDILVVVVSE